MTVEHQLLREEVMAEVDGQLAESRRAAIRAHLDGCAECRALVEELGALSREIAIDDVEPAPATLGDRARVLARRGPRVMRMRSTLLVTAAAGVVLAAVVITPRWFARGDDSATSSKRPAAGPAGTSGGRGGGGQALANRDVAYDARARQQGIAPGQQGQQADVEATRPLVVRTASLWITTDRFDTAREAVEALTRAHDGRIAEMTIGGQSSEQRSLRAVLRIPPARLDAALAAIRQLGRVTAESAGSEDVTESVRDLRVRIANSRREEQRLVEILGRRTGTLKDVLEVERELARVRGEVERMEAQERAAIVRVDFATVMLNLTEAYRADMAPAAGTLPLGSRLRNAVVDGIGAAGESLVAFVTLLLQFGPVLAVWLLILAGPARTVYRRLSR